MLSESRRNPRTAPRKDVGPGSALLFWIGTFKLIKCCMLVIVGVAALRLAHGNMLVIVSRWAYEFRVDPDNRFVHHVISRLFATDPRKFEYLAVGTFIYAAIFATEGTGLLLRKRWAEYFTVISTSLLIPLEVYEVLHHLTVVKVIVLAINVAIVCFLIQRVRTTTASGQPRGSAFDPLPPTPTSGDLLSANSPELL